ncbi:MAG: hypothetical protein ACRCYK_05805 [Aeromonas hydrophila]
MTHLFPTTPAPFIHKQHKEPALTGWPLASLESPNMTRLISGLEVHRYAPELNTLHLRNRQVLPPKKPKPTCLAVGSQDIT